MIATSVRLPSVGETISADSFLTAPGGKGANQALAARRAGAKVKLFGAVGDDEFAATALSELNFANIDLSQVKKTEGTTGIAIILVGKAGENVIVIVPGANAAVDEKMALSCIAQMSSDDYLVLVQEIRASTIRSALVEANSKGIKSILNIAPAISQTKDLALLADIVIANETEVLHLIGKEAQEEKFQQRAAEWAVGNNKILIITLGDKGVVAFTPDQVIEVGALKITPVDTVGAGDSFCGYFAAGLEGGMGLKPAMQWAAAAGSLACLKPTAQKAIPLAFDVLKAMQT